MACDKRRANEDQARQTEYEEVSLPPYVFLSMPVLLITSTSSIFHPFSGHLTKKASWWRSFFACLIYHVNFIYFLLFRWINRVRVVQSPNGLSDSDRSPGFWNCRTTNPRTWRAISGERMRIRLDRPSMKRYRFLRMFFFLCLSYLSRRLHLYFILFRVTWPKKRVGGVLSLPVLFITSTSYISCFFGELTEFVSFKVLTDFLILIDRQDSEIVEFSPVLHAYPTNSNVGAPHDQQQAGSIFS